jgi:hypothetical protein
VHPEIFLSMIHTRTHRPVTIQVAIQEVILRQIVVVQMIRIICYRL